MRLALELEEDSVTPWEREVVARSTEERTHNYEYGPEHEEDRKHAGHELTIFWFI
jgi:hypothetical protein